MDTATEEAQTALGHHSSAAENTIQASSNLQHSSDSSSAQSSSTTRRKFNDETPRHSLKMETASVVSNEEADSLAVSDELMKQEASGCLGFIERLPLGIKLVGMALVSVIGILIVGILFIVGQSYLIAAVQQQNTYMDFGGIVTKLADSITHERRLCRKFLLGVGDITADQVVQEFASQGIEKNVEALVAFIQPYNATSSKTSQLLTSALTQYRGLSSMRTRALAGTATPLDSYNYYSELSRLFHALLNSLIAQTAMSTLIYQHNILMQLKETQARLYGYMEIIAVQFKTMTQAQYNNLALLGGVKYLTILNAQTLTNQAIYDEYMTKIEHSGLMSAVTAFENYALGVPIGANITINGTALSMVNEKLLDALTLVIKEAEVAFIQSRDSSYGFNYTVLVVVILVIIASIVLSLIVKFFIASTIAGPWKRLIHMQDLTMTKFVPKGSIKLLNCRRITEVELNKTAKLEEIGVVSLTIKKLWKLTKEKSMNPNDSISFVNHFFDYIRPCVELNGGYVERFNADGVIVVFKKPKKVVKFILELQATIHTYNTKVHTLKKPWIDLGIGFHSSQNVTMGALGDGGRIQPCLFSEDITIASELDALTRKFKCTMIVSKPAKDLFGKLGKFRLIAKLKTKADTVLDLYELLDMNASTTGAIGGVYKLRTKEMFSRAVKDMFEGNYSDAMTLFEQVHRQSEGADDVASFYENICKSIVERHRSQIQEMTSYDSLRDTALREAFEKHCKKEYSAENIRLWGIIEDFKAFTTLTSRKLLMQKIASEFLDMSGESTVNITAEARETYSRKIQEALLRSRVSVINLSGNELIQAGSIMDNTFFNSLQAELELVMNDAHKRFKVGSELFRQAFPKSKYAVKPESLYVCIEEETN